MKIKLFLFLLVISPLLWAQKDAEKQGSNISEISLVVLGTVQDGGSPHIGCNKECCRALFENPDSDRKVVSLGLINPRINTKYLFEATPDITTQIKLLAELSDHPEKQIPNGIFLTHAHIGHYTGLMYLGKEALGASNVEVYSMPKMKEFLENNGPWDQLVSNKNIQIAELQNEKNVVLDPELEVTPIRVPHRDEYSETVGYKIKGPNKAALFIPDIDKWGRWDKDIIEEIKKVDYAFIDATFYDAEEINNRDISEIPHPFIIESMSLFKDLPAGEKKKVYFIHLNHTNPALNSESGQYHEILKQGYNIARIRQVFTL